MFTMPAIHHSSVRMEDGCMGTMHLNALNGSSTSLGFGDSTSRGFSDQKGVFGNLFPSSLTDSHTHRTQDRGSSYRESFNSSNDAYSSSSTSGSDELHSHRRDSIPFLKRSERGSSIGQRRRSFDLNELTVHPRPRYRDRSLSVGELVIGPISRFERYIDASIYENDLPSGVSLAGLNLDDESLTSPDSHYIDRSGIAAESTSKSSHPSLKKKKGHVHDASVTLKTVKMLEKIKDSSSMKHSRNRSEDCREHYDPQTAASKSTSSRQNKSKQTADITPSKQERDGHSHRERKSTIRTNAN